MPFLKSSVRLFSAPEAREQVCQVSGTDLANGALHCVQFRGQLPPRQPKCCDAWAMIHLDGVLHRDFTVEVKRTSDEIRFLALLSLIGDIEDAPDQNTLQAALRAEPKTLLLALWGQDEHDVPFAVLYHHPRLAPQDAKRWLNASLGCGPFRAGWES